MNIRNHSFIFFLGLGLLAASFSACTPEIPTAPKNGVTIPVYSYTLIWADEFNLPDGSSPDGTIWNFELGGGGWGNGEQQYYTSRTKNAQISNGNLIIRAYNEPNYNSTGYNYTSARLISKGKATFAPTTDHPLRIEARIKPPTGYGYWPAFWMMGSVIDSIGWPKCGEIDIMELKDSEPTHEFGTIHFAWDSSGTHGSVGGHDVYYGTNLSANYHVYRIDWDVTGVVTWYFDGNQMGLSYVDSSYNHIFKGADFFFLLNVAVGGTLAPNYLSGVYPGAMFVDYLRVYQMQQVN